MSFIHEVVSLSLFVVTRFNDTVFNESGQFLAISTFIMCHSCAWQNFM